MKKLLTFLSIFISLIYLSSAIDIVLNSWQKLESSSWSNLSSVLNKIDVFGDNLSVNGKLAVNWKICLEDNSCLWECAEWIWDSNTLSCKAWIKKIVAWRNYSFAIKTDGSLWAWWENDEYQQLWTWDTIHKHIPTKINIISSVKDIAPWHNHVVVLKTDWTVRTWWRNGVWQLWTWNTTSYTTPQKVDIEWVASVYAWENHSFALKPNWDLWWWGHNGMGQLWIWNKNDQFSPVQVSISDVKKIVSDNVNNHNIAIKTDWTAWVWWRNGRWQLCSGNTVDSDMPTQIEAWVTDVTTGRWSILLAKSNWTVWGCWQNNRGQLLSPKGTDKLTLTNYNMTNVKRVIWWGAHFLMEKTDWTFWWVWCNAHWQYWNWNNSSVETPVKITNLEWMEYLDWWNFHTIGLKNNTIYSFWENGLWQLWLWHQTNKNTPTPIPEF
jgi:alpha-tubulin suppressor-like RCC1 family protein